MQVAKCNSALALSLYSCLLVLLVFSRSSALYRLPVPLTQDCSLYSNSITFQATDYSPSLPVSASFSDFKACICTRTSPLCPSFCESAGLVAGAGGFYQVLTVLSSLLCGFTLLRLVTRLRGKSPQTRLEEWGKVGLVATCVLTETGYWAVTRGLGEVGVGLQAGWAACAVALIGAVHSRYVNKRLAPGLHRIRTSELEGTNIDPARHREENHLEYTTEPSSEEKKASKHQKELESLKERLESEESARKALLADNHQLVRQVEEREKALREIEQKANRTQQNVQVTAALSLAKQKEEEVLRLIGRLRDAEERAGTVGKLVEEMKGKVAQEEKEKTILGKELEQLRTEKAAKATEEIATLRGELQAARTEVREKEREASLILRTAQGRESEEVRTLTAELEAGNSREREWTGCKALLEGELEALKRENEGLRESLARLKAA